MRHYQLTPRVSLTLNPCRPAFKYFAGKTNRLALYSMSLCGVEMNLYVARNWAYNAWEDTPAVTEPIPAPIAPFAAPVHASIVQFRSSPDRQLRLPPPAHSNH